VEAELPVETLPSPAKPAIKIGGQASLGARYYFVPKLSTKQTADKRLGT